MKTNETTKRIANNAAMLMIFNIAKIIFPFVTLPYLTRILSTETYGIVTYVKTVMNYMQIFVDFGFVLSATKDIVKIRESKDKMAFVIGDTMIARIILGLLGFVVIAILSILLPILRENFIYTCLSYVAVFESIFLMDFLFRGLEKMQIITIRFILMKLISTVFTFIFIKNDSNVIFIPILEIISSTVAIILVFYEFKKMNLKVKFTKIENAFKSIKESFVYFLSNVASTSFNAFSTIIIGIYISKTEVAFWGLCIQIIGTIQACYSPISDGIYPEMIKSKNLDLIKKVLKIFIPIILIGCILAYFLAETCLKILGGDEYINAVSIFRLLIPVLFFGFLGIMFGWPTLGAIGKSKQVTISTISGICVNIVLILLLLITNNFNLITIAIARDITEIVFFSVRFYFFKKYKYLFKERNYEVIK